MVPGGRAAGLEGQTVNDRDSVSGKGLGLAAGFVHPWFVNAPVRETRTAEDGGAARDYLSRG
jgi:hypothetical protein